MRKLDLAHDKRKWGVDNNHQQSGQLSADIMIACML